MIHHSHSNLYSVRFTGLSNTKHNIEIGKTFPITFNNEQVGLMQVVEITDDDVMFQLDDDAVKLFNKFGSAIFQPISFSIGKI